MPLFFRCLYGSQRKRVLPVTRPALERSARAEGSLRSAAAPLVSWPISRPADSTGDALTYVLHTRERGRPPSAGKRRYFGQICHLLMLN